MLGYQLSGLKKIIPIQMDKPKISKNTALIKPHCCGICGSDVHAFEGKHPLMHPPLILGHEFSGDLVELKGELPELSPGDKVTAVPLLYCGKCYNCQQGVYNRCQNLRVVGCQAPGAMAEYVEVPVETVIKLPDDMPYEIGALIEPFAVGLHSVSRSRANSDSRVLILGAGPIGLCVLAALKAKGINNIVIADVVDFRLNIAKNFNIRRVVNVQHEDFSTILIEEFGESGTDLIFECAGVETTITQTFKLVQRGGQIIQVGVPAGSISAPLDILQDHEIELIGTLCYLKSDFEKAIQILTSSSIDFSQIITHHFPLKDVQKAFEYILGNRTQTIKVMLDVTDF